jgi:hypothetical protein
MTSLWRMTTVLAVSAAASTAGQALSAEDSLRATHQTLMEAVVGANAQRVSGLIHAESLGFFRESQRVADLKGGGKLSAMVEGLLGDLGEFTSNVSLSTTLRLVGDTGIVTQTSMREQVVEKKKVVRYLRSTAVYVRSNDSWKLISWHTSDTPLVK